MILVDFPAWPQDRRVRPVTLGALATACLLASACIPDADSAGGFVGVIDGDEFTVTSGRAEIFGDTLEIVLSDTSGDGCSGFNTPDQAGDRKLNLSTSDIDTGTHATSGGAIITIQIVGEGQVINSRTVEGSFTLQTLETFDGGEVSGTIRGTTDDGDDLNGDFFVPFCP